MCATQIIAGAVLQALGFTLVLLDLHLIRSSEGRTIQFLEKVGRILGRAKDVTIEAPAVVASASALSARVSVRRDLGDLAGDELIEGLVFNLGETEKELDEARALADKGLAQSRTEIKMVREEITQTRSEIEQQIRQREKDEAEAKNRSDRLQGIALALFVAGLVLTTLGSV